MLAAYSEGVSLSAGNTREYPTLPPELLSQIFYHYSRMSIPYNPEEGQGLGQKCLTEHLLLVCKSWYDAATSDSSLWNEIILHPEITRVTPYRSLYSYIKVRSIRSRTHLLHVSISNNRDQVGRLAYLKAYYQLLTTMPRWERLFCYLECHDALSCITIHHLTASTPHLREVVIRSSIRSVSDLSQILPETPNLEFLEISMPSIGPLSPSFHKSVTTASIQTTDVRAWVDTISQFERIHTLILQPNRIMISSAMLAARVGGPSLELPSVHTLIIVGPFNSLHFRLRFIDLPALQTLEVDLSRSDAEKRWSGVNSGTRKRLSSLLNAGLRKLVFKSVWFDRWQDLVNVLLATKGRVEELVCIDVTCTIQSGEEQKIDMSAILMQHGVVSSASALTILCGFLKGHGIEVYSN